MADTDKKRRYMAFLSYSQRDRVAGERLFRLLDGYQLPRALRGRRTATGVVPDRLYPVFRDREELATATDLSATIADALTVSDHLVVLCSPEAANSTWVNREIERFGELDRVSRIHPVLLQGTPEQSFPPALKKVGLEEPLAVDLRPDGDGWSDGVAKLTASILGVPFGELRDREAARARRRTRIGAGLALLFAVLAITAVVAAFIANDRSERIAGAMAIMLQQVSGRLSDVESATATGRMTTSAADAELAFAQVLTDTASRLAPDNSRINRAKAELLLQLATNYQRLGRRVEAGEALGAGRVLLSRLSEEAGVARATQEARATLYRLIGSNQAAAGNRIAARRAFEQGLAVLGGDSVSSLTTPVAGEVDADTRQRLAMLQADLSDQLGLLARSTGDLDQAMAHHEHGLSIREAIVDAHPEDDAAQFERSVSLNFVGDIYRRKNQPGIARRFYEESLEIRADVVDRSPENLVWKSGLARTHDRLGELLSAQGQHDEAVAHLDKSLRIHERLVAGDRGNLLFRQDQAMTLSIQAASFRQAGDVERAAERNAEAISMIDAALAIDVDSNQWQLMKIGDLTERGHIAKARNDLEAAYLAYDSAWELARQLLVDEKLDAESQFVIAQGLISVGDLLLDLGVDNTELQFDVSGTFVLVSALREAAVVLQSLLQRDPDNDRFFSALHNAHDRLARAYAANGNESSQRDVLLTQFTIAKDQSERFPDDVKRAFTAFAVATQLTQQLYSSGEREQARRRARDAERFLRHIRGLLAASVTMPAEQAEEMRRLLDETQPFVEGILADDADPQTKALP